MKDASQFALRASRAWIDACFTGAGALATIAADPRAKAAPRMAGEKLAAAGEASIEATFALGNIAVGWNKPAGPLAAANAAPGVAQATVAGRALESRRPHGAAASV